MHRTCTQPARAPSTPNSEAGARTRFGSRNERCSGLDRLAGRGTPHPAQLVRAATRRQTPREGKQQGRPLASLLARHVCTPARVLRAARLRSCARALHAGASARVRCTLAHPRSRVRTHLARVRVLSLLLAGLAS